MFTFRMLIQLAVNGQLSCIVAVIALSLGGSTAWGASADDPENLVDYAFATWIATGTYKVAGRSVAILKLPFFVPLRAPEADKLGLKLELPVTVGAHRFSDLPENLETITFVPGIEVQVPVRDNWLLKPFGQAGIGKDFSGGGLAYIYGVGVKSVVSFPWRDFNLSVGNRLLLAGSTQSDGDNTRGFSLFDVGLHAQHPLDLTIRGRKVSLGLFFIRSFFHNDVDLKRIDREPIEINRLNHVGFTLGTTPPLSIWNINIPRFGLTYVWGDGLRAVRLNAGFPF